MNSDKNEPSAIEECAAIIKGAPLGFSTTDPLVPTYPSTNFAPLGKDELNPRKEIRGKSQSGIVKEFCKRALEYNECARRNHSLAQREEIIGQKKEANSDVKKSKAKGRCYTCSPRGKIKKHIIQCTDGVTFHHDLWNRPFIIVTPNKHHTTLRTFSEQELIVFFNQIHKFCSFWNIVHYEILWGEGNRSHHEHFYVKIKADAKLVRRIKKRPF